METFSSGGSTEAEGLGLGLGSGPHSSSSSEEKEEEREDRKVLEEGRVEGRERSGDDEGRREKEDNGL